LNNTRRVLLFIVLAVLLGGRTSPARAAQPVESYRDVPGVTAEDIAAVEKLKTEKNSFVLAASETSETFYRADGGIGGWTQLFCAWLSEFFGIPFRVTVLNTRDLYRALNSGKADFTSEIIRTPATLKKYLMTGTIAVRTVKALRTGAVPPLDEIAKFRPVRFGILFGDAGLSKNLIDSSITYPFETVPVYGRSDALRKFADKEIDALVVDSGHAASVEPLLKNVFIDGTFPYTFIPVTLSTIKPELAPIINVVQKYLDGGHRPALSKTHLESEMEFKRERLLKSLTADENAWLAEKTSGNNAIGVSAMRDFYPFYFFNSHDGEWQGMAADILHEIELLTGLAFEAVAETPEEGHTYIGNLESGAALVAPQLHHAGDRVGRFLWADKPYAVDRFAFISLNSVSNIEPGQISGMRVGYVGKTVYEEAFRRWFPKHDACRVYDNETEAFAALEKGETDLYLSSTSRLLYMANYLGNADFKTNLIMRQNYYCYFGFNKKEQHLRAIVSKAQNLIDLDMINAQWTRKVFNYHNKLARSVLPLTILLAVLLVAALAFMFLLLAKNRKLSESIEKKVEERTGSLAFRAKTAEAASRRKSDFLTRISNEFLAPLNAIKGMSLLIQKIAAAHGETRLEECVQATLTAATRLKAIADDALEMSRMKTDHFVIDKTPFLLSSLLDEVKNEMAPRCARKSMSYAGRCECGQNLHIIGDKSLITLALLELMGNAVNPAPKNSDLRLNVKLTDETEDACTVNFLVSISGTDMNAEQIHRFFSLFSDVENAKEVLGDMDSDLYMCKTLIQEMGGQVRCVNDSDKEFSFCFTLSAGKIKKQHRDY
jgi:signal transduction histidine kinase/ABC-type amino acid transport substrate-binding protein